ncbi:hypothetical protein RIF29_21131 [Crotalaria pallida]|uniref:Myb-like domain-containing protein n=1 Tax=Crotalaria pallida TaxID=3830 RepID=A0AAN9I5P1_CROPI
MSDPYGLPEDLRRLISSSSRTTPPTHFNHLPQPPLSLSVAPPPPTNNNTYDPFMVSDVFFPRGPFTHHYPPPHHHHHNDYYCSSSTSTLNNTDTTASATVTTVVPVVVATPTTAPLFCSSSNSMENNNTMTTASEKGWLGFDPGNNRWPRQETLSLLEIRSRLDSKFRESNLKAPLWNEISRIMAEEFGYQRSGKKCKEKFENLYKYYKKTKEGKASRQDGKHYRFFRQLEAICGESTTTHHHRHHDSTSENKTHHDAGNTSASFQSPTFAANQDNVNVEHFANNLKSSESLSFSNSSDQLETSSSENNDEDLSAIAYMMKQSSSRDNNNNNNNDKQKGLELDHRQSSQRSRVRKSWRGKIEEIVGSHMRKIIETQDAWMEKMLSVVEQREREMASKEEERKRKESMRFDQEVHELWAKERAWVEARDAALIKVVRKHIGFKELEALALPLHHHDGEAAAAAMVVVEEEQQNNKNNNEEEYPCEAVGSSKWTEMEISNLIQLRNGFEERVRENGYLEHNGLWDEIAAKLGCLGFDRSASECKQIWDEISISLRVTVECSSSNANKTTRPWCLGLKLTDDDEV